MKRSHANTLQNPSYSATKQPPGRKLLMRLTESEIDQVDQNIPLSEITTDKVEPNSLQHRRSVRKVELERAMQFFGLGRRVLEIGAGAGWQANMLTSKGYQVTALDIPDSNYAAVRERHITIYDGVHIPAPDRYFDVIFSSNVLEHVTDLHALQEEMFRVLKPGGTAIHIMPTSTWRLWTSCGFYINRAKQLFRLLLPQNPTPQAGSLKRGAALVEAGATLRLLFPPAHGVSGSWVSELYLFSEHRWVKTLRNSNWEVQRVVPNELFYSGYKLFGDRLSLTCRRYLSKILGSSCKIYVLRRSLVSKLRTGDAADRMYDVR